MGISKSTIMRGSIVLTTVRSSAAMKTPKASAPRIQ
jgi:hypothetical protein